MDTVGFRSWGVTCPPIHCLWVLPVAQPSYRDCMGIPCETQTQTNWPSLTLQEGGLGSRADPGAPGLGSQSPCVALGAFPSLFQKLTGKEEGGPGWTLCHNPWVPGFPSRLAAGLLGHSGSGHMVCPKAGCRMGWGGWCVLGAEVTGPRFILKSSHRSWGLTPRPL